MQIVLLLPNRKRNQRGATPRYGSKIILIIIHSNHKGIEMIYEHYEGHSPQLTLTKREFYFIGKLYNALPTNELDLYNITVQSNNCIDNCKFCSGCQLETVSFLADTEGSINVIIDGTLN